MNVARKEKSASNERASASLMLARENSRLEDEVSISQRYRNEPAIDIDQLLKRKIPLLPSQLQVPWVAPAAAAPKLHLYKQIYFRGSSRVDMDFSPCYS